MTFCTRFTFILLLLLQLFYLPGEWYFQIPRGKGEDCAEEDHVKGSFIN